MMIPADCFRVRVLEESREMQDLLAKLLDEAADVRIVSGYVRTSGLRALGPRFDRMVRDGCVLLISGHKRGQLTKEVVEWFRERGADDCVRIVRPDRGFLHAKAWLLRSKSNSHLWPIIGSTNLTESGLGANVELALFFQCGLDSTVATELDAWFECLLAASRAAEPGDLDSESDVGEDFVEPPPVATPEAIAAAMPVPMPAPPATQAPPPAPPSPEPHPTPRPRPRQAPAPVPPAPPILPAAPRRRDWRDDVDAVDFIAAVLLELRNPERQALLRASGLDDEGRMDELNDRLVHAMEAGVVDPLAVLAHIPASVLREIAEEFNVRLRSSAAAGVRRELAGHIERLLGRRVTARSMPVVVCAPGEPDAAGLPTDWAVRWIDASQSEPTELLAHQKQALHEIERAVLSPGDGLVLALPTATGKTRAAVSWLLRNVVRRDFRALWIAHSEELIGQAVDHVTDCAAEASPFPGAAKRFTLSGWYGVCPSSWKSLEGDIVVASIQSLDTVGCKDFTRRNDKPIFAVVVDEAHHVAAPTWRGFLDRLGPVRRLGLSATPFRTDDSENRHLTRFFQRRWGDHPELEEALRRDRILAEIENLVCPVDGERLLRPEDEKWMDHFHEVAPRILSEWARDPKRARLVVETYQARAHRKPTLVFAIDKEHAVDLDERFRRAGVRSAVIVSGDTAPEERRTIVTAFRHGELDVLCNVRIAAEGVDFPKVEAILMARPTMSYGLYKQMVGRGLRGPRVGGSERCLVIDFVDNLGRFNEWLVTADKITAPRGPRKAGKK